MPKEYQRKTQFKSLEKADEMKYTLELESQPSDEENDKSEDEKENQPIQFY